MLNVLIFLLVLSVLVLVHEFGHYIAARLTGVKADEFGYGFPPRALGFVRVGNHWKRIKGRDRGNYTNTIWSLNWLPLGGFVRLKGEQGDNATDPDSFLSKNGWQKLFILVAGVAMNWLLAASIFSVGFMIGVPSDLSVLPAGARVSDQRIEILQVVADSGADEAGLKVGDTVLALNGRTPQNSAEVRESLKSGPEGTAHSLTITRKGAELTLEAQTKQLESLGRPGLGVVLGDIGNVRFSPLRAIFQGFSSAAGYTAMIIMGFFGLIGSLFTSGGAGADVSGPVGIAVLTGQVAEQGGWALAHFTALLSLNLAVINFLPIPALDGGRAVFVLIESLRRRRNNPLFESAIHQIGFTALLILILLVTIQDFRKYGQAIWNGLLGIVGLN